MKKAVSTIIAVLMLAVASPVQANPVSDWWDSLFGDDVVNIDQKSSQTNIQGDLLQGSVTSSSSQVTKVTQGSLSVTTSDEITIKNLTEVTTQMALSTSVMADSINRLTAQVQRNTLDTNTVLEALVEKNPVLQIENASGTPFRIEHTNELDVNLSTSTLEALSVSLEELRETIEELQLNSENQLTTLINNELTNMGYSGGGIGGGASSSTTLDMVRMVRNAAFTPTTGVDTKVTYDAESYDLGSGIGDTGTGTVTIVNAGTYQIRTGWFNSTVVNNVQAQIYIDGALYHRGGDSKNSGGGNIWATAETTVELTAGQTVEGYVFTGQASAADVSALDQPFLEVIQQPTTVNVDASALTPVVIGQHKFTAAANNAANFPGANTNITFDSFTDTINSGSIATFDGTNIVVTAGTYDVELTALIHTNGSGPHNGVTYFRDASDVIGFKYGDGADANGASSRGEYGEGSDNTPATAVVRAGTTVTLNVVHNASANSQNLEIGSYIYVKELVPQSNVAEITVDALPTSAQTNWSDGDFGVWNDANTQLEPATVTAVTGATAAATLTQVQGPTWTESTGTNPGGGAVILNTTDVNTSYTQYGKLRFYTVRFYIDTDGIISFGVDGAADINAINAISQNSESGSAVTAPSILVYRVGANELGFDRDDSNDDDTLVMLSFTAIMN